MNIHLITQSFLDQFPGDFSGDTMQRQTPKMLFATVEPALFTNYKTITFNQDLSNDIGLGSFEPEDDAFLAAQDLPKNIRTYATAYAGHQFGQWAGQLGDGRAILAGEIQNTSGETTEIQWKGAGATPYSRFADGRAVLRSSVREYLMSEAMHHLGVPTTRALSLAETGEMVTRDILYNGNPKQEKGAVVIRTAPSFVRFGHFQLLAAQNEIDTLKNLADFCIQRYFREIKTDEPQPYHQFFKKIAETTANLMVEWQRVGFTHGVMNTDNMSILGLSIDYGPFSMLDEYNLNFTPNTTDLPGRRYAFGRQAEMAQWNLWQLGNALFPLINDVDFIEQTLEDFGTDFWNQYDQMMCSKMGLDTFMKDTDVDFFTDWQNLMTSLKLDYTLFFNALEKDVHLINWQDISYKSLHTEDLQRLNQWINSYQNRLALNKITPNERLALMSQNNPKFTLRNYLLHECIEELNKGNASYFNQLLTALKNPYQETFPEWSVKRPKKYDEVVGCSTLSCSS